MKSVGKNEIRKDGADKVTGRAKYIDDCVFPRAWFGATLRSSIAHGRIKKLHFDPKFPWHECVVVTAKDIPGKNHVLLMETDQPLLADKRVYHPMEAIALVAHPNRQKAYHAVKHIRVEYEELEPVRDVWESLKKKKILYGKDNVFKRIDIKLGNAAKAMKKARYVVSETYRVPHQEQTYIENNGIAAYFQKDGTLVVTGSLQCPYYVVKALGPIFNLPEKKIRVIQATTGGGFGGKEEYPNMIAGHAALLAKKAKRPIKLIYDRHEDMLATTKRHPAVVRRTAGVAKNGKLVAMDIDIVMDGGAYMTLSPVVLSRGILHATGPYECPDVTIKARCVATNTPPNGAFRGFGAPQTLFGAELHWEKISEATGIDVLTLRRRNILKPGSIMATGQVLRESVGASKVLERCLKKSGYARKRARYDRHNRCAANRAWKGVGLALVHHGAGFTGTGEVYLQSRASVALTPNGKIRLQAAAAELGQGSTSTLSQIVADALKLPYDLIEVETPDTHKVPDSGPTVASRTCMVVGGLLHKAALALKTAVVESHGSFPVTQKGLAAAAKTLRARKSPPAYTAQYEKPQDIEFDDKTYRGDAYGSYGYAALVADLEVDKTTFEVRVHKIWTSQDIGKAIHPKIVEGQIIGGTTQGLGWALLEKTVYKDGILQNPRLTDYIIPTALDTPPMDVDIVEEAYSHGPFGAKGVGEMPMDVPAPAVAAAIRHATGLFIPELPILPETIARYRKRSAS